MHSQKWTQFEITSRKKKCAYGTGFSPNGQEEHSWWAFSVEDDPPWTISVQVLPQRPRGPLMCQTARAPGRFRPPKEQLETKEVKDKDADMTEAAATTPGAGTRGREAEKKDSSEAQRQRSRSAPKKDGKDEPIFLGAQPTAADTPPNDPDAATKRGWKQLDYGGCGDCLFRAVGAFLEKTEGVETVSVEKATARGALLRTTCVQHIRKHEARFKEIWHPKLDGTGPQTYEDWVKVMAKQETYANGAMLQALAERLGSALVVWSKRNESWERFCVAARFGSNGLACRADQGHNVALLLSGQHYTLLQKPENEIFPSFWLSESPGIFRKLEGGASSRKKPKRDPTLDKSPHRNQRSNASMPASPDALSVSSAARVPSRAASSAGTPRVRSVHSAGVWHPPALVPALLHPEPSTPSVRTRAGSLRSQPSRGHASLPARSPSVHTQAESRAALPVPCGECPGSSAYTPSVHTQVASVVAPPGPPVVMRRLRRKTCVHSLPRARQGSDDASAHRTHPTEQHGPAPSSCFDPPDVASPQRTEMYRPDTAPYPRRYPKQKSRWIKLKISPKASRFGSVLSANLKSGSLLV